MRKVVFLFGIFFFLFSISIISSAENGTEQSKVSLAYSCLEKKMSSCSSSYEDNIFTLLALKKCKNEVLGSSKDNECWPKSGCTVKATAQAILALNKAGSKTKIAEDWLSSKNKVPSGFSWYLQIDSPRSTTCSISYSGSTHSVFIGDDKKISSGAGSCLSLSDGGWWLRISESCYSNNFDISCDKQFITSLMFKRDASSTIHVSGKLNSASAEGKTLEKVNSLCFAQGNSCDYEGTLWAALTLNYLGQDVSSYMPYLIAMYDANKKDLPESFLYILTGGPDYRAGLLEKQKIEYWDESGDKFYDTAVALYPFQYEEISEKTASKKWLLEVQDSDGCWKGSIKNTAFLLNSIWPKDSSTGSSSNDDCKIDGKGYCISGINCREAGGRELSGYSCSGVNVCCDTQKILDTCKEMRGEICSPSEECSSLTIEASDTFNCCTGYCRKPAPEFGCQEYGGVCRFECSDEEEGSSEKCDSGKACCVKKTVPEKSYWWLWILIGLIALALLGIIFRDKLRPYWFKIFGKSRPRGGPGPRFPINPGVPMRRAMPRMIFPQSSRPPVRRPIPKKSGELDEVLKKLKNMGK